MPIIATLRVPAEHHNERAPTAARLAVAAQVLRNAGIDVLSTGHYSVIISATAVAFANVLGLQPPEEDQGMAQNFTPREPALHGLVDRIEIASPAQYLDV